MENKFINRKLELEELERQYKIEGLIILYGRGRVAKTKRITNWIREKGYTGKTIDRPASVLVEHLYKGLKPYFATSLIPKNWKEFYEILELHQRPIALCIDKYPSLVDSISELPSIMQKWLESSQENDLFLFLTGSNQSKSDHHSLNTSAPLFDRVQEDAPRQPKNYHHFCKVTGLSPGQKNTFETFSLVGAVPRFWEFFGPPKGSDDLSEVFYFDFTSSTGIVPRTILADENINSLSPLNILGVIGRGEGQASEMASSLDSYQSKLSETIKTFLDANVMVKDTPFGENAPSTKRLLYRVGDPCIRFWFNVFALHRPRWRNYSSEQKETVIKESVSSVFQNLIRNSPFTDQFKYKG